MCLILTFLTEHIKTLHPKFNQQEEDEIMTFHVLCPDSKNWGKLSSNFYDKRIYTYACYDALLREFLYVNDMSMI